MQLNIKPCIMVIKERDKIIKIITGSNKLDQLLGGGLERFYYSIYYPLD